MMTNEEFQRLVLQKFDSMEKRFDKLEERIDSVEGKLDENIGFTKAHSHQVEALGARIDGLKNTTASAEAITNLIKAISKLDSKFDLLNDRLFNQEAELKTVLKAVQ